jgi:hypothetical protein
LSTAWKKKRKEQMFALTNPEEKRTETDAKSLAFLQNVEICKTNKSKPKSKQKPKQTHLGN